MLNRHARAALAELDALGARAITPDEIVALHTLGERLDSASASESSYGPGSGLPVSCGDVTLWPLTCAGEDWWRVARQWFRGQGSHMVAAYAYCLAHGRDAKHLEALSTPKAASRAVRTWFGGLGVTIAELDAACTLVDDLDMATSRESVMLAMAELAAWDPERRAALLALYPDLTPRPTADTPPNEGFYWRGRCAELAAMCGGDPEQWYSRDLRETLRCFVRAMDAIALRSGIQAKSAAPKVSPAVKDALRILRREVADILERRKPEPTP